MNVQLAESRLGRIWLHLLCACRDRKVRWHWVGIRRELSHQPIGSMAVGKMFPTHCPDEPFHKGLRLGNARHRWHSFYAQNSEAGLPALELE